MTTAPPSGIAKALVGHEASEAIDRGWDRISNGELLKLAEAEGFELLLTTDKRIRYQQNLTGRKIGIVVLGNSTWRVVRLYLERVAVAVNAAKPGSYAEVDPVSLSSRGDLQENAGQVPVVPRRGAGWDWIRAQLDSTVTLVRRRTGP